MIQDGFKTVAAFASAGLVAGVPLESGQLLGFASQPSKYTRSDFEPGHFTVSAVLAEAQSCRVFLIYHAKLERWLQPGGHIEASDSSIAAAAVREAEEETGFRLETRAAKPVALSVHRIPAWGTEPSHLHLDLQFLFELPIGADRAGAELEGRWVELASEEAAGALEYTRDRVQALLDRS